MKVLTSRFSEQIAISGLHAIVDLDLSVGHVDQFLPHNDHETEADCQMSFPKRTRYATRLRFLVSLSINVCAIQCNNVLACCNVVHHKCASEEAAYAGLNPLIIAHRAFTHALGTRYGISPGDHIHNRSSPQCRHGKATMTISANLKEMDNYGSPCLIRFKLFSAHHLWMVSCRQATCIVEVTLPRSIWDRRRSCMRITDSK